MRAAHERGGFGVGERGFAGDQRERRDAGVERGGEKVRNLLCESPPKEGAVMSTIGVPFPEVPIFG